MIKIQLKRPALDVESQYQGKGVQFSDVQAVSAIAGAFSKTITTKIIKRSGPLYYGELEKLILDPLVELSISYLAAPKADRDYVPVLQGMATRGVSYAIIDQLTKVYEVREVSKFLTNEMLSTSPIWKAITSMNGAEVGLVADNAAKKDESKNPADCITLRLLRQWISGDRSSIESDKTWVPNDDIYKTDDPTVMAKIVSAEMFQDGTSVSVFSSRVQNSISEIYKQFLQVAKTGKGMALSREGRADVNQKLMVVRAAVEALFAQASEATSENRLSVLATGMAVGAALLNYMKMAEDPDAYFPRQELQFNVIAWAGGLKQEASELKNFWTYHAISPGSFTIELARQLWNMEANWMSFMGEEFEVMRQARASLQSAEQKFEVIQSSFYKDLAVKVIDDVMKQSEATHVLPINWLRANDFKSAVDATVSEIKHGTVEWKYDGSNDVINPTKMFDIPPTRKTLISEQMAMQAQVIADAYSLALRTAQLVSLTPDDVEPIRPYVPMEVGDLEWEPTAPLRVGEYLSFSKPPTISAAVPKWAGAPWPTKDGGEMESYIPKWTMQKYLYTPFRPIRAMWEALDNMQPLMMWRTDDVPEVMGDAISRPWGTQTIPACYTYSRNRSIRPYTMREYLLGMQGVIDGIPGPEYLKHAAELIALYGHKDPLAQAIINYLAPAMSVASSEYAGGIITPTLKTIYGVPTEKFMAKQSAPKVSKMAAAKTDTGFTLGEKEVAYTVKAIRDGVEKDVVIGFRLHDTFPVPAAVDLFSQTLDTGLSVICPITASASERFFAQGVGQAKLASVDFLHFTGNNLIDAIIAEWKDTDVQWMIPGGFAPFKLWMPGTYFRVFERPSDLVQDRVLYAAAAAVRWKVSEVTGALQVRGFINDPIELMDNSDRLSAMDDVDPVPTAGGLVKPENVTEGTQAPGHAGGPSPEDLAPKAKEQRVVDAEATLKIPALQVVQNSEQAVKTITVENTAGVPRSDEAKPMAGSPSAEGEGDVVWISVEENGKKVLKKVKKSEVPSGAVLASEEEVQEWLRSDHGDESK